MKEVMRTLRKIFLHNFFKNYLRIYLTTILSMFITSYLFSINKTENSEIIKTIAGILSLIIFTLPLAVFTINTDFPKNIKFLINQSFNRFELMKFFFYSQTLKLVMCLVHYVSIVLTIKLIDFFISKNEGLKTTVKNSVNNLDSPVSGYSFLYYDLFIYFSMIAGAVYLIYISALFSACAIDVQKQKVAESANGKSSSRKKAAIATLMILSFIVLEKLPYFIINFLVCGFLMFTSVIVVNRVFNLFAKKNTLQVAGIISVIFCLPLLGLTYGMRVDAQNSTISFKKRFNAVETLGFLAPTFSEQDKLGFLREVSKNEYNSAIKIFGNKVNFNSLLATANSEAKGKAFINSQDNVLPQDKVEKIVTHMSKMVEEKKLNFEFVRHSYRFYRKQKVNQDYLERLADSSSLYQQFASIHLAHNSLSNQDFIRFLSKFRYKIDGKILLDPTVKRSIASAKRKLDLSQNKK